ncbi:MAG: ATP-binding protein [Candidatus Hadarchaeota archaeon]
MSTPLISVEAVPKLKYFFGRQSEISQIKEFMESDTHRVLALRGMAGVGKTALISKMIENYGGGRSIVYVKVYPYSTLGGTLSRIAAFLEKLGRKKLANYLSERKENLELEGFLLALQEDLMGTGALVVIDDLHYARDEITKILAPLMDVLDATDAKVVIAGRVIPHFYDKRDILVRRRLKEVVLGGLDEKSACELLTHRGIEEKYHDKIYSLTQGHPLMLELAKPDTSGDAAEFVEREIWEPLGDVDKKTLGIASVFRMPFPLDAIRAESEEMSLKRLTEKLLLKEVDGNFEVHEMLRAMIYNKLTVEEKVGYHRFAAEFYIKTGIDVSLIEAIYHLTKGYRQQQAAAIAIENAERLVRAGYGRALLEEVSMLEEGEVAEYWPYVLILRGDLLSNAGQLNEARQQYELCTEYTETTAPKGGREVFSYLWFGVSREFARARALAHFRLGATLVKMGNNAAAWEAYSQSLQLFKELGAAEAGDAERALKELESQGWPGGKKE